MNAFQIINKSSSYFCEYVFEFFFFGIKTKTICLQRFSVKCADANGNSKKVFCVFNPFCVYFGSFSRYIFKFSINANCLDWAFEIFRRIFSIQLFGSMTYIEVHNQTEINYLHFVQQCRFMRWWKFEFHILASHRMHPILIYSIWFIRDAGCVWEFVWPRAESQSSRRIATLSAHVRRLSVINE